MYAVVGCNRCSALWVVEGRPETTGCPRCGKRRAFEKLRRFAETEDADAAREARARLLAGEEHGEAVDDWASEEREAMASGPSDREFLEAAGVDADAVADAGERGARGAGGGSRSNRQVVFDALDELDAPTEDDVKEYAADAGVSSEYAERALEKLVRAGEVTESGGAYRRL